MPEKPIRILIINGSVRKGNYTSMATAIIADELAKSPEVGVEVLHPETLDLPLPGTNWAAPGAKKLQEAVKNATAIILATPEYHGSFSSVIKLVIENLGFPSALAGKPVALVGVAAGAIGAIKSLEHLRGVVSHVGGLALPLPTSIANVQSAFDADGHVKDPEVEARLRGAATNVVEYIGHHICPRVTLEALLRKQEVA